MHDKQVIHRNLKCSNILMNGEGEIKISDGGAQRKLIDAINRRTLTEHVEDGPHYLPPEVLLGQGFCKSSDIWAIGCCMIEMLTGKPAWSEIGTDNEDVKYAIILDKTRPKYPDGLTSNCIDFLNYCFANNKDERVSAEMLLNHHPFLAKQRQKEKEKLRRPSSLSNKKQSSYTS